MRLIIIDENYQILEDFGAFTVEEAEAFFMDAMTAIRFRKELNQVVVQNEVQMRLLMDTFNKMGLLHGNPEAIQDWMRPYISNEILRLKEEKSLFERANAKLDHYKERAWSWLKLSFFTGVTGFFKRFVTKNK